MNRHIRALIFKIFNHRFSHKDWITVGENTQIYITTSFSRHCTGGGIVIGDNCRIGVRPRAYYMGYAPPTRFVLWGKDAVIKIGNHTAINGISICARKRVEIGDKCMIAGGIQIVDSDSHLVVSRDRARETDEPREVKIGNNVWIGLNAIILKGTRIGDNCVVGAGSVVKGEFPANTVIAGNPARAVRTFELP